MTIYGKTFAAAFLLGFFFFGFGPPIHATFGLVGSVPVAILMLIPCWILCHGYCWISNDPKAPWVDMGWAIFAAVLGWAWVRYQASPTMLVPTLLLMATGVGCGAAAVHMIGRLRRTPQNSPNEPEPIDPASGEKS